MLFGRRWENNQSVIDFNNSGNGDKVSAAVKELITINCLKNMSFFMARNQVNVSLPLIDAAKNWMKEQIMPTIYPHTNLTNYAQRRTSTNSEITKHIVDFLLFSRYNLSVYIYSKNAKEEKHWKQINDFYGKPDRWHSLPTLSRVKCTGLLC